MANCLTRIWRRLTDDPVDRDIAALRRELDGLAAEKIETTDDDLLGGPQ